MSVPSADRPWRRYVASSGQTLFSVPFRWDTDGELKVFVDGVAKSITTDYSTSGKGTVAGGSLTFGTGLSSGAVVTLYREQPLDRTTDFTAGGSLTSSALDGEFDDLVLREQEAELDRRRSLKWSRTLDIDAMASEMPDPTGKGGYYGRLNGTGTGIEWVAPADASLPSVIDGGTW